MALKDWLAKRKSKRAERKEARKDPYDDIIKDLKLKLLTMKVDDPNFEKTRKELDAIVTIRDKEKESKRRLTKQGKGDIIGRILSLVGAGVVTGGVIWAEKHDMVFTGEKRSIMDSVSRTVGNLLFHR